MKRIIYFLLLIFTLTGCGTVNNEYYKTDPCLQLRAGMSQEEVEYLVGPPERVHTIQRRLPFGDQEILQYWTSYDRPFGLEFINDCLVSAYYIYGSSIWPMYPWEKRPRYGQPIFPPSYRPDQLYYPQGPPPRPNPPRPSPPQPPVSPRPPATTRPPDTTRPPASERPPANTTRPESTPRPTENTSRPAATTRSSGSDSDNNSGQDNSRETRGN